jgi:hypothetical protein
MLKHLPQQLMLKSEKYFMKLVRHRRAPEDTIIIFWGRWRAHKLSVNRVDLDIASDFQVDEISSDNEDA